VVNGEPALTTTYISPAQSTINFDAIDHIFATVVADELARGVGTENAELSADEYMQENFGISYLNTEATKPISGDPLTENNKRWLITEALNNLDSEAELDLWVTQIQQKTDASEEMLNTLVENVLQVSQGAGYDSPNDEADTITFAGDLDKSIGPDEVKFIYYNKGNVLTGSEWSVQSVTDISVKVIGDYDLGSTQVFINGELITREIINGILEITNEIEVGVYVLTFSHKIDDDIVEIVNKRIYIDSSEPTVNMSFLMPVNYIDDNNYLKNASLETVVENKNTILLQNNHSSIDITNGIDVVASRIPQIRYRVFDNDEIITHEVIVDNKQGTVITYDAVLLDSPFNDYVIAINELFLNRDSTPINRSTTYDITIRIVDKALNTMIETTSVTVISHEVVTKTESKHIDTSQYNFDNRLSLRSEVLEASRHMIGNDSGEDLYLKIDQSGNETNPLLQTYNEAIRVNYARLSRSTKEFRTRRASSYSCDATWGNYFSVSTIYKWGYSDDPSETGLGWGAMRATSVPLSDDESSTYRYVSDDTHSGTWVNIAPNATRDYDLVTDPRNRATAGYIRCPNGNINHAQIRQGYAYASASGYPRNETTNGVRETSMPQPDFKLVDSISLQELGKNSRNEYILETGKSAILLHNQSVPAYPVFNIADVADIDTFRRYVTSRLDSLVYMLLDNTVDLAIRDGQTGNTYKQNITETVTPFIIERPENWQAP